MHRLFETHNIRKYRDLSGLWDFETLDGRYCDKLAVPSCWEVVPELATYKGVGVYRKTLKFGGRTRLVFKGASHTAKIFCDGKQIGMHYNAYTPFYIDFECEWGSHEIKVEIDNSYSNASALHVENDYYTYGGIIRPLLMEQLSDAVINYLHVTPKKENGAWHAEIKIAVESKCDEDRTFVIKLKLEDETIIEKDVVIPKSKTYVINFEHTFDNISEYSPENPNLYLVLAELYDGETAIDDLIERVGFREISIDGKNLLLNGKKIRLFGFNRHEDYNSIGPSIPLQAMMRDLALIKETGANSVRTCHYPNDELFLDACDELGLLVWEEGHARGLNEEQMRNENFMPQSLKCIDEMIINHYNHPSIFCWGILNECVSDTEFGRACYQQLYDRIASLDKSRPKTSASNKQYKDICFDLEEIVSINMYPEWYDFFNGASVKATVESLMEYVAKTGNSNKPFIVSEIGAGAIYGYRSDSHCKWSEERQASIIDEQLSVVLANEDITGVFIWQFCDVRVDESWFSSRPRCENNKGIVDEYRRKKLAFEIVKRHFKSNSTR